ncbi:MAG: hypothetical protein ACREBI_07785 [Nitrosotalea sp.]
MKTLHLAIIVISGIISSGVGFASADVEKSTITVNDTQYEIDSSSTHSTINTISANLHSYVYNSLDMNITSDKQYDGSLTLTLTKDAVANVFCITRSDVDNYLKSGNAFDVAVDNNPENFTASYTNNETSLTFDIPKGSQNATIFNEFVGMAVSPLVYFKGIPQTGAYSSGQDVTFNGTLVDACGRHLGMEKVYFTAQQLNVTKEVTSDAKGKLSINFTIPANTESGNYTSKIEMYQYGLAYPLSGVETLYLNVKTNSVHTVPESPLQQFKSGTAASDVKCNDSLQLVFKTEDGSPACVSSNTAQILIERGWALNFTNITGKESISLSAYQGESFETFYNNGTVVSNFTINVNINNFKPSNALLILQVYYNDGTLYKAVNMSSDMIQPDGFYKYQLTAVSDENHPVPFKVVATYNKETAIAYAPVFAHP